MPTVDWAVFAGDVFLGIVKNESATMSADWRFSGLNGSYSTKEEAVEAARTHLSPMLDKERLLLHRRECGEFTDPAMKAKYG